MNSNQVTKNMAQVEFREHGNKQSTAVTPRVLVSGITTQVQQNSLQLQRRKITRMRAQQTSLLVHYE